MISLVFSEIELPSAEEGWKRPYQRIRDRKAAGIMFHDTTSVLLASIIQGSLEPGY